jgi:hypothetical protein
MRDGQQQGMRGIEAMRVFSSDVLAKKEEKKKKSGMYVYTFVNYIVIVLICMLCVCYLLCMSLGWIISRHWYVNSTISCM